MLLLLNFIHTLIEDLETKDLYNTENFLIYIYYERLDFKCPLCNKVFENIKNINFKIKKLNFYENPYLGSKFMSILFPTLLLKINTKIYYIDKIHFFNIEDLCINFKKYNLKPLKWYNDPRSYLGSFNSYLFYYFYIVLQKSVNVVKSLPLWLFSFLFGGITFLLFLSVHRLFTIKD